MYLDTRPDKVEVIPSMGWAPWTRLPCSTLIAKDKAEAAEEDGKERAEDMLVVYSDRLLVDGGVGAAAVLFKERTRVAELRYHLGKAMSTQYSKQKEWGLSWGQNWHGRTDQVRKTLRLRLITKRLYKHLSQPSHSLEHTS
jgi:hypothetical protein